MLAWYVGLPGNTGWPATTGWGGGDGSGDTTLGARLSVLGLLLLACSSGNDANGTGLRDAGPDGADGSASDRDAQAPGFGNAGPDGGGQLGHRATAERRGASWAIRLCEPMTCLQRGARAA